MKPKSLIIFGVIAITIGIVFILFIFNRIPKVVPLNSIEIFNYVVPFILYMFFIIAGLGVLILKEWGRKLIILSSILGIFNCLRSFNFSFFTFQKGLASNLVFIFTFLLLIGLSIIFIWYFTRPTIKALFGIRPRVKKQFKA